MYNELLWFAFLLLNFISVLLVYRYAGKTGLYVWIPISTILANIQCVKLIPLFGFEATLGNIVYATSFLVTDILSENYGKKHSSRAVYIGFFSLFSFTAIMKIAMLFTPSVNDVSQVHLATIFDFMPRLAVASVIAYGISNFHDVWAYHFWKKVLPGTKFLWVRNNLSTMISQFLDSVVFTVIAFYGVFSNQVLIEIFGTTYVLKFIVAFCDTPFIYAAHWMNKKGIVHELN